MNKNIMKGSTNMTKKKAIFLSITILFIGLIISAGTYAFWSWSSNSNKNIVFNTAKELKSYIVYDEGESKFVGDFKVSDSYTDGIHSTISLYKTSEAANADLIATIYMDVNSIGDAMKESSALKWKVTQGDSTNPGTTLAQGNFIGVNSGTTLTLVPNIEVTTTLTKYTVWIWIDASENPSDNLTGETFDSDIWTEINQTEGVDIEFKITRLTANNQAISATVVNNKNKIVKYAITNSIGEPSSWTDIVSTEQNNIYNLNTTVNEVGTYYIWFMDSEDEIINEEIEVTNIVTSGPICTFGNFSKNAIGNNEIANITLTCTDESSTISKHNLTTSDITTSSNNISVTNISKTSITNGYSYQITITGTDNNDLVYITLPQDKIKNNAGYGNNITNSGNITVIGTYVITLDNNNATTNGTSTIYERYTRGIYLDSNYQNEMTSSTNPITIPVRTGYSFSGYYDNETQMIDENGYITSNFTQSTFTANKTLTVRWTDTEGPTGSVSAVINTSMVKATLTVSDTGSGVNTNYGWKMSTDSNCDNTTTGFTNSTLNPYSFAIGTIGTNYICVRVSDNAGNTSYFTTSVDIKAYLKNLSDNTTYFKEADYKEKITDIEFVDYINTSNAVQGKDPYILDGYDSGIIQGWLELNDETNNTYSLYIGSDGPIYANTLTGAFANMNMVRNINLNTLNTSETTSMTTMFSRTGQNATSFSLNLGNNFDTSNVTSMAYMFSDAGANATDFDLNLGDNFDTSNVTGMRGMFSNTGANATNFSLDLGNNFNTSNVTSMQYTFSNFGRNATNFNLNLGDKFNTSNVTNMYQMFSNTGANATNFSLNLGNKFDPSNITDMYQMFSNTGANATNFSLDLGNNFNTSNVTSMQYTFSNTGRNATNFDLNLGDKFNTSNVTKMTGMFSDTGRNATNFSLDLGNNFNTLNVTIMSWMFSNTGANATNFSLNLGDKFNTSNVTEMTGMFSDTGRNSTNSNLDLGNKFDTSKVTTMSWMFYNTGANATNFSLNLGDKFNTSNVTNMYLMFSNAGYNATNFNLDLGNNFDISNVTNMTSMLYNVGYNSESFSLNLGNNFNTSKITNMASMFSNFGRNASNFSLDLGNNFNTSNVTNMASMFSNTGANATNFNLNLGDKFNTSNVTNMASMFKNAGANATNFSLDLGNNFDTSKVTTTAYMFSSTGSKSTNFTLNLGDKFDTSKVTTMTSMFSLAAQNATNFNLNLGNKFDTSNVTDMKTMFYYIGQKSTNFSLNLGDKFNTSKVTNMYQIFYSAGSNATNFDINLGNKFDISNVTNIAWAFYSIGNKTQTPFELDLSAGNLDKIATTTNYMYMLGGFPKNYGKIYVKDTASQNWIIDKNSSWGTNFSATNVLVKGS